MKETQERKQVIVVTGASAGVGRATVRALAKPGTCIGLVARGRAGLEAAAQEVELAGGKALVLPADMADYRQVEAAAARVRETFGPVELWINVAMTSVFSPVKEMTPEEYKRVTEVTYLGYVYGTLAALKQMLPRDKGVIVQVGSALAYRGIPLQSAYCASKHAIQGFDDSLITELMHDKSHVKVTMVQMPALNTPQFRWVKSRLPHEGQPVPPIFQPEVAAEAIVYAAKHTPRELFVGWPTVKAIQGNKIAPWYADHMLAKSGYRSQQTDQPLDRKRPDNLWEPVDSEQDYGAHGVFDSSARSWSAELWARLHWARLGKVGLATVALAAFLSSLFIKTFGRTEKIGQ